MPTPLSHQNAFEVDFEQFPIPNGQGSPEREGRHRTGTDVTMPPDSDSPFVGTDEPQGEDQFVSIHNLASMTGEAESPVSSVHQNHDQAESPTGTNSVEATDVKANSPFSEQVRRRRELYTHYLKYHDENGNPTETRLFIRAHDPAIATTEPSLDTAEIDPDIVLIRNISPELLTPVQAERLILIGNISLVFNWANEEWRKRKGRVSKDDLVQTGVMALLRAIRGYDPINGTALFSTYATTALIRSIHDEADRIDHTIYVPANVLRIGRSVVDGVAPSLSDDLTQYSKPTTTAPALPYPRVVASLDAAVLGTEGGLKLNDFVPAPPTRDGDADNARALAHRALKVLDPTSDQRRAVEVKFGLPPTNNSDTEEPQTGSRYKELTYKEVAAVLGISEAHATRLVLSALRAMRAALKPSTSMPRKKDDRWKIPNKPPKPGAKS